MPSRQGLGHRRGRLVRLDQVAQPCQLQLQQPPQLIGLTQRLNAPTRLIHVVIQLGQDVDCLRLVAF